MLFAKVDKVFSHGHCGVFDEGREAGGRGGRDGKVNEKGMDE